MQAKLIRRQLLADEKDQPTSSTKTRVATIRLEAYPARGVILDQLWRDDISQGSSGHGVS